MSGKEIILIGSLPPTRSNAAVLMDRLAHRLSASGLSVTCLIDTLAPAPYPDLPYQTVRINQISDSTDLQTVPRLYVLGAGGDSLFAYEVMQRTPGGVIIADKSLLPIAPAVAEITGRSSDDLIGWFEDRFGDVGSTAAHAAYTHRRISNRLPESVDAYEFMLDRAESLVAVSQEQKATFTPMGKKAELLNSALIAAQLTGTESMVQSVAIIGASRELKAGVSENIAAGPLSKHIDLRWCDRHSQDCTDQINDADAVIILDGQDAAVCPLYLSALSSGKLVLDIGQHWARDHSAASALPSLTAHPASLTHAIAALHTVDRLAEQLIKHQNQSFQHADNGAINGEQLLELALAASKNTSLKINTIAPLLAAVGPAHQQSDHWQELRESAVLIGSVAIRPIFNAVYSDIDFAACPKFMEKHILAAASGFTGEYPEILAAKMGFEAPVWDAGSPARWAAVRSGLKNDRRALLWGGQFSCKMADKQKLSLAPATPRNAQWTFKLSDEETSLPPLKTGIVTGFQQDASTYWRYDTLRKTLKLFFMAGSAGALELLSTAERGMLVHDAVNQNLTEANLGQPIQIAIKHHGLAFLELAALPSQTSPDHSLLKQMSEHGLSFIWKAA